MFLDLDCNPNSGKMAILQQLPDGSKNILIYDISARKVTGEVDRYYIPQSASIRTPLFMLHGGRDTTSTNNDVLIIQSTLRSNGTPCELSIFHDDIHGLTRHRQEMFQQLFSFLQGFERIEVRKAVAFQTSR